MPLGICPNDYKFFKALIVSMASKVISLSDTYDIKQMAKPFHKTRTFPDLFKGPRYFVLDSMMEATTILRQGYCLCKSPLEIFQLLTYH